MSLRYKIKIRLEEFFLTNTDKITIVNCYVRDHDAHMWYTINK